MVIRAVVMATAAATVDIPRLIAVDMDTAIVAATRLQRLVSAFWHLVYLPRSPHNTIATIILAATTGRRRVTAMAATVPATALTPVLAIATADITDNAALPHPNEACRGMLIRHTF